MHATWLALGCSCIGWVVVVVVSTSESSSFPPQREDSPPPCFQSSRAKPHKLSLPPQVCCCPSHPHSFHLSLPSSQPCLWCQLQHPFHHPLSYWFQPSFGK